eukprot:TRINITY_DN6516_c0_g1_i4.p1 TRINITY_DN6516_c0_g1~~TRINITY_DN6516_c0_g1_i4.p1  ORF type:complete len:352 (-),score=98.20 TRINITY_DN6516_c0_g1_i4:13-1068(-)
MGDVEEKITLLKGMFGDFSDDTLRKVLKDCNTVENAVDRLLTMDPHAPSTDTGNATEDTPKELTQEESDTLFAQKLMLEEINKESTPVAVPLSDEEYAKKLQEELNGGSEDERLARSLQSQWSQPTYNNNGNNNAAGLEAMMANFDISKLGKEELAEITSAIKEQMIPVLLQQLKGLEIPEVDETVEAGKKFGPIAFGLSGIKVEEVEIPKDKVTMELEGQQIELKIVEIKLDLQKFDWHYKKEKFPKLKDSGHATCGVSEVVVNVRLNWAIRNGSPNITVSLCEVKIGSLSLKISGTIASVVYNIIVAAFKKLIKAQLEKAMAEMVHSAVTEHAGAVSYTHLTLPTTPYV